VNLSRRSFFALGIALPWVLLTPRQAFAHEKQDHNKELERVLFGTDNYKRTHRNDDPGKAIRALESAIYLCIDQFGGNGTDDLEILRAYGVDGLPKSVEDLEPEGHLSPSLHRSFTHRGWDYNYTIDKANWKLRKTILINTVEAIFNFKSLPTWMVGDDEKCTSFAAFAYYVHVLGDYIEDDSLSKFRGSGSGFKISFAQAHPSDDNPDIFWEIEKHLKVVFKDQINSGLYRQLRRDLRDIARRSRDIVKQPGEINSDERFEEIKLLVSELMALLAGGSSVGSPSYSYANRIKRLLNKEDFFKKVFPQ